MIVSNRNLLFQGLIFRFYVKLRGSIELRTVEELRTFAKATANLFQTTA